ncbi:glycoside hydrolase family 3 N-terminal domain-containing protein [Macrococcus equi]|uniref:glycoside hydrolase family 3 N-terminal domain-containing protein n=1 Tax=Macrococcus equi TaxID=3395462 RepID=UPI0039BE75C1
MAKKYVFLIILIISMYYLSGCKQSYHTLNTGGFGVKPLNQVSMIPFTIDHLTLEEKIAQHFILGFEGTSYNDTLTHYNDLNIGGVLFFKNNIQSTNQTRMLTQSISSHYKKIPMFIAVDQEGGRVNRFPDEIPNIEPAYQIRNKGSEQLAYEKGRYIGQQLNQLGFNVDFAPSLDIWSNPANAVISDRSFGNSYQEVIKYGLPFNRGINDENIITSAKHFPGHGDTFVDSHESLPISPVDKQRLLNSEIQPFKAAIKDDIDMVMVSHILFPQIDAKYPSSMSRKMIKEILQTELGYKGVIITDDLAMGAIANEYSREVALSNALNAGETMLLIGSNTGDIDAQIQYLKKQVENGNISEKIIDENVEKILKLKQKYGIV